MARARRMALPASLLWLGGVSACAGGTTAPAPVSVQQGRTLLEPARLEVVGGARDSAQVPSAVSLGGPASGTVLLYLEFPRPSEQRRLARADLVLDLSGAPGSSIEVELSSSESSTESSWAFAEPRRAVGPRTSARLSVSGVPVRLDVREIVLAQSEAARLCLLLRAEPTAPEPVLVATGASGGTAPRLDLYWQ